MSSGDDEKLRPSQIAYPSGPAGGGDDYVDYYVGERSPEPDTPPKPKPEVEVKPPDDEPPDDGERPIPPKSSGKSGRNVWLLLVGLLLIGYFVKDSWTGSEQNSEPASDEIVIRVISEPPAHVYRRQLELGMTPLEVTRDESGKELVLRKKGYHETTVSFEGATPGTIKEIKVSLEPDGPAIRATETPTPVETPLVDATTPAVAITPSVSASPIVVATPSASATPAVVSPAPKATASPRPAASPEPTTSPEPKLSPKPATEKPKPAKPPVAAKPPPRPGPIYRPPPPRYRPPPRTDGHRIKPPDF